MLRSLFILVLCLALACCGVYLLTQAASNPDHSPIGLRCLVAFVGVLQVAASLAALYLAAKHNPLLTTYRHSRLETEARKLRIESRAAVPAMPRSYTSAEAAAQAALDSHLSEPDRSKAKLGEALSSYYIGLDQLATYREELDPSLLLLGGFRTVFPVSVDGDVKMGVAVAKENDGSWRFSELGFAPLARDLAISCAAAAAGNPAASSFILVAIPAMSHRFLGFRADGTLYFVCLSDRSSSLLKAGETLPAQIALAKLQPLAAEKHKRYSDADGDLLGG